MNYVITLPRIDAVSIVPNPSQINQTLSISVTVSEFQKVLEPVYFYAGELYAGEV